MFICDACSVACGPKISPILKQVEVRPMIYSNTVLNEDEELEQKISTGFETIFEAKLCPGCAGTKVIPQPKPDFTASSALAYGLQAHARNCKKMLTDCLICQRGVRTFASFPLPNLAHALQETKTATGKLSMASIVVENMITRSKDTTKRAGKDFLHSFGVMKAFEQRGGSL